MKPLPIQILLTIPIIALVVRLVAQVQSHHLGWRRFLPWIVLWSFGLVVLWVPGLTVRLAQLLGIGRGADAILYLSICGLSFRVFRLSVALERQDQTITRLVSELALREVDRTRR